jgi:hypothetical protein
MRPATAPVNWNSPDVPDYRALTPYLELLQAMQTAGYVATEWANEMPRDPEILAADLSAYGLEL